MSKNVCAHLCKSCYAAHVCPVNAIAELSGSVLINSEKCIGCGCCRTACVAFGFKALQSKSTASFMKEA